MIFDRAFWSEERCLTSLLVVLVGYHLAVPLAAEFGVGDMLGVFFLSLLSVSSVLTWVGASYLRLAVRVVAAAAVLAAWWEFGERGHVAALIATSLEALLVGFLLASVVVQVFGPGRVSAHRVRGAIVVYLLFGVLFGFLYELIMLVEPQAIRLGNDIAAGDLQALRRELIYFSFVTLTTVGYGDISPVSPFARALATLEAMSGQLYIAITLARLVSLQQSSRSAGEGSEEQRESLR